MTDPKPYSIEEASRYVSAHLRSTIREPLSVERVLATAQAAAEADSLRARLAFEHDRAERGRERAVALASLLQSARAVVEHAQQNARHLTGGDERRFAAFLADSADFGEEIAKAHAEERSEAEAALTTAQGEVAVLRERLLALLEWAEEFDGYDKGHADPILAAARETLASTRASADAHDERVRREALEEVRQESRRLLNSEGSHLVDRVVESLIKEPSE